MALRKTGIGTPGSGGGGSSLDAILSQMTGASETAQAENLLRYDQALAIYDEIIERYRPGGEFGESVLGEIEAEKGRYAGAQFQGRISAGLTGVTGGTLEELGQEFEEREGRKRRIALSDIQMERLSQAQVGKAGFIERREDVGPDFGLMASLAQQAGAGAGGRTVISGGTRYPSRTSSGGTTGIGGTGLAAPTSTGGGTSSGMSVTPSMDLMDFSFGEGGQILYKGKPTIGVSLSPYELSKLKQQEAAKADTKTPSDVSSFISQGYGL